MFSNNEKTQKQGDLLEQLLIKKFGQTPSITITDETVTIKLLCPLPGQSIHPLNKNAMKFLRNFGEISKTQHEQYSYWNYDAAKFSLSRLQDVISGMKILPDEDPDRIAAMRSSMPVAAC